MLDLDKHDIALVSVAMAAIDAAIQEAHKPITVIRRLHVLTVRRRNKGRLAAIKRHPFQGMCEASGKSLDKIHAVLDELEPDRGFSGRVRWVCNRANNSGRHSCGGCK